MDEKWYELGFTVTKQYNTRQNIFKSRHVHFETLGVMQNCHEFPLKFLHTTVSARQL